MKPQKRKDHREKYQLFRHHAWAGLGFLAVFSAMRLIMPEQTAILTPIIFVLILYIIISLLFTYRYYTGIYLQTKNPEENQSKTELNDKDMLKIEKKKEKNKLKMEKKGSKKK